MGIVQIPVLEPTRISVAVHADASADVVAPAILVQAATGHHLSDIRREQNPLGIPFDHPFDLSPDVLESRAMIERPAEPGQVSIEVEKDTVPVGHAALDDARDLR